MAFIKFACSLLISALFYHFLHKENSELFLDPDKIVWHLTSLEVLAIIMLATATQIGEIFTTAKTIPPTESTSGHAGLVDEQHHNNKYRDFFLLLAGIFVSGLIIITLSALFSYSQRINPISSLQSSVHTAQ